MKLTSKLLERKANKHPEKLTLKQCSEYLNRINLTTNDDDYNKFLSNFWARVSANIAAVTGK